MRRRTRLIMFSSTDPPSEPGAVAYEQVGDVPGFAQDVAFTRVAHELRRHPQLKERAVELLGLRERRAPVVLAIGDQCRRAHPSDVGNGRVGAPDVERLPGTAAEL